MALGKTRLALVGPDGNSHAGRIWKYFTEDSLATCDTAAYFNGVSDLLKVGDEINICVITSLTADPIVVADAGKLIVLTNDAGVVDTSDETAFIVADAD